MTGFWTGEEKTLLDHKLTPAVTNLETLRWLERAAARRKRGPVGFHLKVDSGMNRLGVTPEEIPAFASALAASPHVHLEGVFTHFASSDVLLSPQTEDQRVRFESALERLRGLGVPTGIVHMANSAAIAARPETYSDMVRPGALLYGYHQFYDVPERRAQAEAQLPLRPAMSLRARIVLLRDVAPGAMIGYNARWTAARPSRIAVISAGYADGLMRALTNRGRALVRGQFVPLVGTISMDVATADVTGVEGVKSGDVVTLYGKDGGATQWVSDVAALLGTVSSDLLCSIGKRVPRFYVD
jgi:alanine racemase